MILVGVIPWAVSDGKVKSIRKAYPLNRVRFSMLKDLHRSSLWNPIMDVQQRAFLETSSSELWSKNIFEFNSNSFLKASVYGNRSVNGNSSIRSYLEFQVEGAKSFWPHSFGAETWIKFLSSRESERSYSMGMGFSAYWKVVSQLKIGVTAGVKSFFIPYWEEMLDAENRSFWSVSPVASYQFNSDSELRLSAYFDGYSEFRASLIFGIL